MMGLDPVGARTAAVVPVRVLRKEVVRPKNRGRVTFYNIATRHTSKSPFYCVPSFPGGYFLSHTDSQQMAPPTRNGGLEDLVYEQIKGCGRTTGAARLIRCGLQS